MSKPLLLIVDDSQEFLNSLRRGLRGEYEVRGATSRVEAMAHLSPPPDLVLLDLRLNEEDLDNLESLTFLRDLRQQFPHLPVLMVTAYGEVDTAVECMKMGATDFIQKQTSSLKEIQTRLARALEHGRLSRRVTELEQEIQIIEPREIVGRSPQVQEIKQVIEAVAQDSAVTILIRGETGTGKELVARAIYASGQRRRGPFIPVTIHSLPPQTVEAELFGHEPGAFTDARKRHIGYLEKAHGGVLFLDEIGDIEPVVQGKLLRFLEEREFQRLGSTSPIRVNIQVVAATNADLAKLVQEGKFREDLYFRFKVHEILLPPLRQRRADIPLLVDHFLQLFQQQGKRISRISPAALQEISGFSWPGNIRQLKNSLESAIFWAGVRRHQEIEVEDLPAEVRQAQKDAEWPTEGPLEKKAISVQEAMARTELDCIQNALDSVQGKKTKAWKLLGYNDRFALTRRVKRLFELYPQLKADFTIVAAAFAGRLRT